MPLQPSTLASEEPLALSTKPARLVSLDVFRGGTIASMILVNNQAATPYIPLEHAEWHGWTFTDLVFPFFLWIVGVAITLSFARRKERGDDRGKLLVHILIRAATIFGIGLLLNGFPYYHLQSLRVPGVLQRIAVCYLVAGAIFLYAGTRSRLIWTAALLSLYWALMMLVPVPGCGAGSLTEDCNFEKYVDGLFLSGHMYRVTRSWDPEGVISTLPAICNVLFGIFAGELLKIRRTMEEKSSWLFLIGNVLLFVGLMLSTWMPINKKLWTAPYALFTSGLAFVVFACCYWLVDVRGFKRFVGPFVAYGTNALGVYILSGLLARILSLITVGNGSDGKPISLAKTLWQNVYAPLGSPQFASFWFGMTYVLVLWGIAWLLYRRNWVFKV